MIRIPIASLGNDFDRGFLSVPARWSCLIVERTASSAVLNLSNGSAPLTTRTTFIGALPDGARVLVLGPLIKDRKTEGDRVFEAALGVLRQCGATLIDDVEIPGLAELRAEVQQRVLAAAEKYLALQEHT